MINDYYGNIDIKIFDLIGNNILDVNYAKDNKMLNRQISLQALPSGIYNIIITIDGNLNSKKLVLTH